MRSQGEKAPFPAFFPYNVRVPELLLQTKLYIPPLRPDGRSTYQPMNFDVGLMSFPLLAKVLVIAVILVPLVLVVLV